MKIDNQKIDLIDFTPMLKILWKNKIFISTFTLISAIISVMYVYTRVVIPNYEVSASVEIPHYDGRSLYSYSDSKKYLNRFLTSSLFDKGPALKIEENPKGFIKVIALSSLSEKAEKNTRSFIDYLQEQSAHLYNSILLVERDKKKEERDKKKEEREGLLLLSKQKISEYESVIKTLNNIKLTDPIAQVRKSSEIRLLIAEIYQSKVVVMKLQVELKSIEESVALKLLKKVEFQNKKVANISIKDISKSVANYIIILFSIIIGFFIAIFIALFSDIFKINLPYKVNK